MTPTRMVGSVVVALTVFAQASPVEAYCRTSMPLYPNRSSGDDDFFACNGGQELAWADHCIPIGVNFESFERRGVSHADAQGALDAAMDAWSSADCGGGEGPSLAFNYRGEMHCNRVEYELKAERTNNNIVFLRKMPMPDHATGVSTVTFRISNHEILDGDIEIAADGLDDDSGPGPDLETRMLHELGHFLGLAHSEDESAVMHETVSEGISRHTLSPDDEAGICEIFPPGEEFSCPEEREGRDFTRECAVPLELEGCSVGNRAASNPWAWIAVLGSLSLGAWRRRGSRSRGGTDAALARCRQ